MNRGRSSEQGMILITVLWIVLILSIISFSLAAAVRVEVASSNQSFDSERAFFMAKGAAEVVYNAFAKKEEIPESPHIRRDDGDYVFLFDSGEARVRFESSAGLIDLNGATDQLLGSMFDSLGLAQETRNRLVDAILDWRDTDDLPHLYGAEVNDYPGNTPGRPSRPRNAAFQSVDELLLLKNMTPELFYGSFIVDTATGQYRRVPGVRELVTVNSGAAKVDVNEATAAVLAALPGMTSTLMERITAERAQERFESQNDLVKRVPEMATADVREYLTAGAAVPSMLVSRATIASSGASRTIRLLFKTEEKNQILLYLPLLYKKTVEAKFDRWRFD